MLEFFDPFDNGTNQLLDQQPAYDLLINSEVVLPYQDKLWNVKII